MAIKTAPSTEIPFLQNYQPYSPTLGTTFVDEIKNMVTYNLQPNTTATTIDYSIGTSKSYVNTLTIKNITTNVKINMRVTFNNNIFIVDRANVTTNNEAPLSIELQPNQTEQFIIKVKNSMLDQKITYTPQQTQIKVNIESININDVALRDISTSIFTTQVLPVTITLD